MTTRIRRGSTEDRQLRGLGWRRVRRRRRSNAKQPEVWKRRKIWEAQGRELVLRIVRHDTLFRVEVLRVRSMRPWWQPLKGISMESPLALAVFLELEGAGDPVRFAYKETKCAIGKGVGAGWIAAPMSQMPRVSRSTTGRTQHGVDIHWAAADDFIQQHRQSHPQIHRLWQNVQASRPVVESVPLETHDIERRMIAHMAGAPTGPTTGVTTNETTR